MNRREFLAGVAATAVVGTTAQAQQPQNQPKPAGRNGRIQQSAMRVVFGAGSKLSLDDMCREAARAGCVGFDLVGMQDWPTLKKYGLMPTMAPFTGVTIQDGLIRPELHEKIEQAMRGAIDACAANGCPNIIAAGGQRRGMSYEEGADKCVAFFNRIKRYAEDKNVTIALEIMNTKFTDPSLGRTDQIFDHLAWGVDVCRRVASPAVKILFDVYHAQIMDGDICHNIREYFPWIGHFHVAGVPGRHELDATQELNYRYIAETIADVGFPGYVAHEWRPTPGRDPLESLRQAVALMDV